MNAIKCTPGPWTAEPGGGRGAWVKGANGEWAALACGDSDERAAHNAAAIATLPELYEALERAERKLSAYVGVCKDDKELVDTVLPMARRAMAKTRGEQE